MSLLSRLFGGGGASAPEVKSETYEGFTITPTPVPEGARFRISAQIEKEIGGEMKSHTLIRADVLEDRQAANEASVNKARQMIDEQGDRLFG
ncbi:MAG: HlyU family transcriptional regulator [Silicimonas sp.]